MDYMHKTTIRGRFEPAARSKYQHDPRNKKYLARKKRIFGHTIDLVYSGETRRHMRSNYTVHVGGTVKGENVKGTLNMKFPFAAKARAEALSKGKKKFKNARTAQLASELSRFTDAESQQAVAKFNELYRQKIEALNAGRKKFKVQIT